MHIIHQRVVFTKATSFIEAFDVTFNSHNLIDFIHPPSNNLIKNILRKC